MLDAMESNTRRNDNLATKWISTENLKGKNSSLKKCGEVRRKIKLISFPSYYLEYFENYYIFKILSCNIQSMIYLNKGSSSLRAIYKSILHVIQNV